MWRPKERIKYKPQPGPWPTREEAETSRLFSPIDIGPIALEQRTWVPAMVPWRATEDGFMTQDLLDWYGRYAEGKPGAIVVEATGIRDIPSGPLLRIGHDRFIPGLGRLVDTVRERSEGQTRLFIQIIDFLRINRRPTPEKFFQKYLEITDEHRAYFYEKLTDDEIHAKFLELNDEALQEALTSREYEALAYGYRERVTDTRLPHIKELPQTLPNLFSEAAVRAREAGFDGVELHYAHAYTMASFLSARNTRDDGYGSNLAGRVRLPLEVYAAVRRAVGDDYVVGCRYLSKDCIERGSTVEDAAYFGVEFARAGMDFLSLSRGGKFEDAKQPKVGGAAYPYTGRSGYECMPQYISDEKGPFGRNLPAVTRIRHAIRDAGFTTPVVAAGGIHGFVEAERILREGEADIIAAARQSIADPDWYLKMKLGMGDEIRVCIYSNYCEALDTKHKQVTCELWDRENKDEPGITLSSDGRRRLIPPHWTPPPDTIALDAAGAMNTAREYSSVFHAFEACAAQFGHNAFLRAPPGNTPKNLPAGVTYTYSEASKRVSELIPNYAARDLQPGDRVALIFDSRLEVYLHLLALNALGVSIVPLHSLGTDDDLRYMILHSECRLAVCADEYRARVESLLAGDDCHVIDESGLIGEDFALPDAATGPATEAAVVYTSGTTGKPKACMLSNEYFLALGTWYNGLGGICAMDSGDRLLTPLPPNHMNALATSFTAMMLCGGCVVQVDRFHPRSWWQTVREEKATIIHCLGVMVAILLTLPEEEADDFSGQIKFCFGPGPDPRHQAVFEKRFGFPLIDAWAMTETGAGSLTIAYEEPRHVGERCIGKPAEFMQYRIVDDRDVDLAPGEVGELLVRSTGGNPRRNFFSGYYRNDAATEEGWRGGWWHTGDVVREGKDGNLFFVDRRKNVIRRSGENIAAVEVEAALLQSPEVRNCAVCAVPDEIRGDEVFAFVIPNAPNPDAERIFRHCADHLTYFKTPGYIAFVDQLPLTASQKVSRGDLKRLAAESVANNDCFDLRNLKKRKAR